MVYLTNRLSPTSPKEPAKRMVHSRRDDDSMYFQQHLEEHEGHLSPSPSDHDGFKSVIGEDLPENNGDVAPFSDIEFQAVAMDTSDDDGRNDDLAEIFRELKKLPADIGTEIMTRIMDKIDFLIDEKEDRKKLILEEEKELLEIGHSGTSLLYHSQRVDLFKKKVAQFRLEGQKRNGEIVSFLLPEEPKELPNGQIKRLSIRSKRFDHIIVAPLVACTSPKNK